MSKSIFKIKISDCIKKKIVTQEEIDAIKEWNQNQNIPILEDELVVLFIVACQNDVENTKDVILCYFKFKENGPEIFDNWDVDSEEMKIATNTIHSASIPAYEEEYVVHCFKPNDTSYSNFHLIPILKICIMIISISHQYEFAPRCLRVVMDAQGIGLMHLTRIRLGATKKFLEFLQEAMPLRMVEIHILNTMYIVDKIMAMVKPFMKKELSQLLHFHQSSMDMQEFFTTYIPAKYMPSDYGGEQPCLAELNEKTVEKFRNLKPYFEKEEEQRKSYQNNNK